MFTSSLSRLGPALRGLHAACVTLRNLRALLEARSQQRDGAIEGKNSTEFKAMAITGF